MMDEPAFFAFEDAIHDWCDITELGPENMDLPWGTDWKVKHLSAKDYWTEIC